MLTPDEHMIGALRRGYNINPINPSAPPSSIEDLLRSDQPPAHNFLPPSAPAHPINQQNLGGMLGAAPPTQLAGDVIPLPIAPGPMAGPPWNSGAPSVAMARELIRTNHPASVGVYTTPSSLNAEWHKRTYK